MEIRNIENLTLRKSIVSNLGKRDFMEGTLIPTGGCLTPWTTACPPIGDDEPDTECSQCI